MARHALLHFVLILALLVTALPLTARRAAAIGSWTATGSMSVTRVGHTATLLPEGRVLVTGGGYYNSGCGCFLFLATAELYDPESSAWTAVPTSMSRFRTSHVATLIQTSATTWVVRVVGGFDTMAE